MIRKLALLLLTLIVVGCSSHAEPPVVTRTEAPITNCYVAPPVGNIVGFGVDGQPRQWGTDGRNVKPALDTLVNDLGADFFRVEVFNGETDYEATNDDGNPATLNWIYYDALFATKRFTDLWNYVRYVNSISSTAHVMLAWHGGLPGWFGGTQYSYLNDGRSYSLPASAEDEWVETLLAVMLYVVDRAPEPHPRFDLVSPFNEPENAPPEGFAWADTTQEVRVIRKLVVAMNAYPELAGIRLVVGDHNTDLMGLDRPSLVADSTIAARLAATSFHRYDTAEVIDYVGASPPVFMTEFNSHWRASCYDTQWSFGLEAVSNVVAALQGGATGALFWSDYDAPHIHQADEWQSFGLLATTYQGSSHLCGAFNNTQPADSVLDAMTYTAKPTYQAVRHVFKWIRPNAAPVTMTASAGVSAVAYKNADGTFVVAGVNNGGTVSSTVTLTTSNPPSYLTPRVSVSGSYDQVGSPVPLTSGSGVFSLPGSSVFTLLSSPGDGSGGSGGQGGMGAGGAGAGGQSAGTAGASGAPSGGMSGSSGADAGGQGGSGGAGAGGVPSGGAGQGGAAAGSAGAAGASSGGAGSGGAGAGGAAGAAGSAGAAPMMVAAWSFDEGSGTVAHDASGNGHTGTLVSSPAWTTGSTCKYGGCLTFSGTGKRVTAPDANDLDLDQTFTIMAWVRPTSVGATTWRPVLIKEEPAGLVYLLYASTKSGWIDINGTDLDVTASGNLSTSALSHVAMERNGAELSYWLNGAKVATRTVSGTTTPSTGVLAIGGHSFWGGEWMAGTIDDVRIYNYALTAAQVATAMGAGL